jgi:hypothetical protein
MVNEGLPDRLGGEDVAAVDKCYLFARSSEPGEHVAVPPDG